MLGIVDLIKLKNIAFTDTCKECLVDLRDVRINFSKTVPEKMIAYFEQIKNPYLFKVGDVRVKVGFSKERSFNEAFGAAISNTVKYQPQL